jgi:hypothetical protein
MRPVEVEKEGIGVERAIITNSLLLSTILSSPMISYFSGHTPAHKAFREHFGDQWSFFWAIPFDERIIMYSDRRPFFIETLF